MIRKASSRIVDLAQQAAQGRGAALAQGIHAQADGHCQEHAGKHSAIAAKGSDDVGGDDVQHHVQGVGTGGTAGFCQTLDAGVEQAHGVGAVAHTACQQQRQEGAQQEPEQGLCGNAAHGAGVCNAANGQRNGGKDHGDDHQLQRLDEELADDVEDAKGTLSALGGDILEQQVVDGGPGLCLTAGVQMLPQEHKGQTGHQAADQRDRHAFCKG